MFTIMTIPEAAAGNTALGGFLPVFARTGTYAFLVIVERQQAEQGPVCALGPLRALLAICKD